MAKKILALLENGRNIVVSGSGYTKKELIELSKNYHNKGSSLEIVKIERIETLQFYISVRTNEPKDEEE